MEQPTTETIDHVIYDCGKYHTNRCDLKRRLSCLKQIFDPTYIKQLNPGNEIVYVFWIFFVESGLYKHI